jgi:hypothetical protein
MLEIRNEQFEVFEHAALRRFEDEMAKYGKELSPKLCGILGDGQLRKAIRQAMNRAGQYGFTNRGPIRLYVELMFFCGSDFDTDPQFRAMGEMLRSPVDQMERADRIHNEYLDYLERVCGPDNINLRKAIESFSAFAREQHTFSENGLEATIPQEMARAFPQRAAYVGEKGLLALIHEGRAEAQKYSLSTPRAVVLLVMLKFAFGHGCTCDPVYPWISQTLTDERIVNSAARAARLERKTITWLDHMLGMTREGAKT